MNKQLYNDIARALGLRCQVESDDFSTLLDIDNQLAMSIEFSESADGVWIWSCQAVVRDLIGRGPDPTRLLMLNDDGLLWCYHAIHPYDGGLSLNLVYTFATPPGDAAFAQRLLITVLRNMHRCALEVTRKL
jgi:hypothetical protein